MADQEQDSKALSSDAPVGEGDYVVQPGDCISSIAYEHGHFWETIFNDPANRELSRTRTNHNVLLPGDRLTIPPIRQKEEIAETGKSHRFQLRGVPEVFRLRFLDEADEPRANLPYVLVIDGATFESTTNAKGELKHSIPPNARKGHLILGIGDDSEEIPLRLGDLNPTNSITGVQARLTNLGFDCGPVDGILGPKTRKAIKRFQKQRRLEPTGELDEATLQKLETMHRS